MSANAASASPVYSTTSLDPFGDSQDPRAFYITDALHQRLELIHHLINFGRQIIVLTGPPGAGKSSVLRQVTLGTEDTWHVVRCTAGPTLNQATLLQRIVTELELELDTDEIEQIIAHIRVAARAAARQSKAVVLAIDDAHNLPSDTQALLTQLAHAEEASEELKVILCTEPGQSSISKLLHPDGSEHALVHMIEIPRLNQEQTVEMLAHRWRAAYGDKPLPFRAEHISQIYRQANGVPGKAIVLARQIQAMGGGRPRGARDPARKYLIGGVALIVVFIVFAFFNADNQIDPDPKTVELALPGTVENTLPSPHEKPALEENLRESDRPAPALSALPMVEPEAETLVEDESVMDRDTAEKPAEPAEDRAVPEEISPATAAETTPTPVIASTPLPSSVDKVVAASEEVAAAVVGTAPIAKPVPDVIVKIRGKTPPATTAKPAEPEPKAVISERPTPTATRDAKKAAPATSKVTKYSIRWLRTQANDAYVLQLFGSRDRMVAVDYIKAHGITEKSAVFLTSYDDAPWYVVVYDFYPNREAALAAIDRLGDELSDTKPWARPVSSLK